MHHSPPARINVIEGTSEQNAIANVKFDSVAFG